MRGHYFCWSWFLQLQFSFCVEFRWRENVHPLWQVYCFVKYFQHEWFFWWNQLSRSQTALILEHMVANINKNVKKYLYLWAILDQLSYEFFGNILDSGVLALQHFKFFGRFLSRRSTIFNSSMVLLTLIRFVLAASVGIFFILSVLYRIKSFRFVLCKLFRGILFLFLLLEAVAQSCSVKKVFLEISQNSQEKVSFFATCNFIKKETLVQVFSCELCKISKNTFLKRTALVAASVLSLCSSINHFQMFLWTFRVWWFTFRAQLLLELLQICFAKGTSLLLKCSG